MRECSTVIALTFKSLEDDRRKFLAHSAAPSEASMTRLLHRLRMDLSWLTGRAKTTFTHARKPVTLKTKAGKDVDLARFCESTTTPCRLNPLLFNGHLQTMWTAAKEQDVPIIYRRKIFESDDPHYPGSFAVDFVTDTGGVDDPTLPPRTTYFTDQEFGDFGSLDKKPMIVALHGLSGGSHELYLRHVLAPLVTKTSGWEACVINARGCAMTKITTGVLFNARATWDLRQLAKWLREKFPNRPLYAVGFSLGANILTNVRAHSTPVEAFRR